jgi:hypothetical protein
MVIFSITIPGSNQALGPFLANMVNFYPTEAPPSTRRDYSTDLTLWACRRVSRANGSQKNASKEGHVYIVPLWSGLVDLAPRGVFDTNLLSSHSITG